MVKQKAVSGHYAAIDIGSNAARLLIKDIRINQDGFVSTKEQLIRVPLRLGFDVFTKDKISKSKAKDLLKLIKAYSDIMDLYEVTDYKAYATSAIRDAENGKKIVSWIKEKTGVRIHILTGQEEARLLYRTHSEFIQDKEGDFMYVDVGGGSTELNLMLKGQLAYSRSYNIGTIRVLSNTVDPAEWDRLERDLTALMKSHSNIEILGTGGNINKIFRLVEEKDKKLQRMTVASLEEINHHMSRMSLVERVKSYRLKYDRAEVIVPASHIFLTIARLIGASFVFVDIV